MSINTAPSTVSRETYEAIFEKERRHVYPTVDVLEQRLGFAVDRDRLETAAAVLSCPFKAAEPNWQHGRVIYAVARAYLSTRRDMLSTLLDIGTAKGFSALCLQWALIDSGAYGQVSSVDVMCPDQRCRRNTVAEVDELKTLSEILQPWPESRRIVFACYNDGSRGWLAKHPERVHLAYIDGKHTYEAVKYESSVLSARQESGDVIICDDIQIPGINTAVVELKGYDVERVHVLATRGYAIARKR